MAGGWRQWPRGWTSPQLWAAGLGGLFALGAALGLKLAYSQAGASELSWVLAPSCQVAGWLGGVTFIPELGAGWISHQPRMVVGPACAGVNFLVACWLALYFGSQGRFASLRQKLGWCGVSLLAAYVATIAANGVRIALAAHLLEADIYTGWLTPARAHRLLGIVTYVGALLAVTRVFQRGEAKGWLRAPGLRRFASLGPFAWYLAIAVGVPLANRAYLHEPSRFVEHVGMTLAAGLAMLLAFRLLGRLVDRVS